MEKKIEDFAEEKFSFELPQILVLPSSLDISVRTDTGAVGSFKLRYKDDVKYQNRKIRGYITCNDYRFKFDLLTFSNNEVEVDYEFDGRGLEAGQEYNGNIHLITDCGEINVPYYISIKEAGIITGNDEINNIYQFISLAKNDFEQSVKIFYSDEFEKFILKDKEEEIIKKILNEVEKQVTYLKEEVESIKNLEQNKDIVDFKKILQKILNDTKKTYKRNLKQIKSDLELEITALKNHYDDYRVEKRLKDKLFEILDFEEDEVFDSEIIFGIDKLQKDENYKELSNFFKPNRRSKEVNRDINELLKKNFTKIYFYGHSLADADFTFFEDLFKSNVKLDFINKVQTELVFLYERDFFNDENIKNIVKLFYNYYFFSNSDNPKTEDEILDLIFSLRKKGILKIKIRENNKDEYEEQNNILILDNREKLKELLLKIKR